MSLPLCKPLADSYEGCIHCSIEVRDSEKKKRRDNLGDEVIKPYLCSVAHLLTVAILSPFSIGCNQGYLKKVEF